MAEQESANSQATATEIPPGTETFTVQTPQGPLEFEVDIIDALRALNKIIGKNIEAKTTDWQYLDEFGAWLESQGGPKLKPGQLEWLATELKIRHAKKNKEANELLTSLQITED